MKEKKEKTEGKATHFFEVSTYLNDKPKEKNEWKPVVAKKEIIDNYEKDIIPF